MKDILQQAYNGNYYTIIGCEGDLNEWKEGYAKILSDSCIGTIRHWIEFNGADMNSVYGLTGDNAYQPDLHFLAFRLEKDMDINKLAFLKLRLGDRWFNDIVDNNMRREMEKTGKSFED
jgi:hypothetical protein